MIRTLEALIAAIILLVSIVILFSPAAVSQSQVPSISYSCLKDSDNKGFLRHYAENYLADDLENQLKGCMPSNLDYSVKICNTSACNPDSLPNKEIILSSYVVAGDQNSENRVVSIWVWFK